MQKDAGDTIREITDDALNLQFQIIITDPKASAAAIEVYNQTVTEVLTEVLAKLLPSGESLEPGKLQVSDEDLPLLVKIITQNQLGVSGITVESPSFQGSLAKLRSYVRQCLIENLYKNLKHCWFGHQPDWQTMVEFIIMAEALPLDPHSGTGISATQLPCLAIERVGDIDQPAIDNLPVVGLITSEMRRRICGLAYADQQVYPDEHFAITLGVYEFD